MPYLKCVDEEEAKYILEEIHEGVCGNYAGSISLVSKVIRTSYFWPTMQVDAMELVKRCDKCQIRETDNNSFTLAFCTKENRYCRPITPR